VTTESRIAAAVKAIEEVYKQSATGGALHIVIDDENVEDYWLAWCATPEALKYSGGSMTPAEAHCFKLLTALSEEQRARAIEAYNLGVIG
jgi:hypothetical protein